MSAAHELPIGPRSTIVAIAMRHKEQHAGRVSGPLLPGGSSSRLHRIARDADTAHLTAQDFRIARDRVAGQPGDEAAWLAIEQIYDELKLPHRPDNWFNELTDGQRAVYVLHWVQSEIRNGGFAQLYFNSTGRFAALAPAAARQVGADDYATVFARANALFADDDVPEQTGRRRQALREVLDERGDELDAIENDFFALLGQADIYDHLGRYVMANPQDFFLE